ncbi:ABC-2 type transport system permease protein [Inquilinus ginsengisoli]|uniref:ABC-2 type transport system permease protein n=1 Tax=Inquilinus ginsengisoli TaxID=363840 RepID=A0ABU1JXV0_9PROT|nr:ABC transporter permease [Inquilinus ginsengisoli]MDR6293450.1 ABC-2 type transport system permease protein [Inquilinus ginsengisoli]
MSLTAASAPQRGSAAGRILAVMLRHLYVLRGSVPRLIELAYWPTVQMVVWGLITESLAPTMNWQAQAAGVLLSAVLLWDLLFRAQLGMSISFLEEMWSRNLGHLFVSPLRPWEWAVSLMAMSLVRTLAGVVPAALLAILLYHWNIFSLGLPLLAFFVNLIVTGWAIALVVLALILRYGMGAEGLAWAIVFAISPISAIYYPVAVLPGWLQWVALATPPAHVFEGMRGLLHGQGFDAGHFLAAAGLNLLWLAIGCAAFTYGFHRARDRGSLLQQGE